MTGLRGIESVGVVGAGAWGTALAILANRAGSKVTLWSRNSAVVERIQRDRINEIYLPGIFIDPSIQLTAALDAVSSHDAIILAVPSQNLRSVAIEISDMVDRRTPLVIATKGIERGSLALMSEIVNSVLPENPVAIISGPNFADEAAKGQPTATTIACKDETLGEQLLYALGGKMFRPYWCNDIIGTQIGGAVKNVIAIACGIAVGKGFGENARAALITRGLAEIVRLCIAKGGKYQTLMGLSGIGDLMLTCSSMKSRNFRLGYHVGQGHKIAAALNLQRQGVTEGIMTAESVTGLGEKFGTALPICQGVQRVLNGQSSVEETLHELLERPFTPEFIS